MEDFEKGVIDTGIPITDMFWINEKVKEHRKRSFRKEVLISVYKQGRWFKKGKIEQAKS